MQLQHHQRRGPAEIGKGIEEGANGGFRILARWERLRVEHRKEDEPVGRQAELGARLVARNVIDSEATPFGEKLMALLKTACHEWRLFKREHQDRDLMRRRLLPTVEEFIGLLVEGAEGEHDRVATFCAHLIQKGESVFTFLDHDCPPSNNAAERDLRNAVLWRKVCLGSQSKRGFRFVERILTAVESLRAQGRHILDFLVDTMTPANPSRPPPSLLPA